MTQGEFNPNKGELKQYKDSLVTQRVTP